MTRLRTVRAAKQRENIRGISMHARAYVTIFGNVMSSTSLGESVRRSVLLLMEYAIHDHRSIQGELLGIRANKLVSRPPADTGRAREREALNTIPKG